MSDEDGLICAYRINEHGRGESLDWSDLSAGDRGFLWVHLDLESERARQWVREESGLSEIEADAVLAEETRPRATSMGEGLVLILRGVNLNPGADPEDMVAVRMWADANRVISVRRRRLLAVADVRESLATGRGPRNVGEFIAELAERLVERMAGVLGELDEDLDAIEEGVEVTATGHTRARLLELRRRAISLRRYLSPQRDALVRVATERIPWLGERERLQLREVLDRTTRYVEDLEAARERAAVTHEELAGRLSEELNQRIYALSIVAGVFLPLSFVTGLLGINVAGIPGAETWWAFAGVSGSLVFLALGEIVLFRRLGWL